MWKCSMTLTREPHGSPEDDDLVGREIYIETFDEPPSIGDRSSAPLLPSAMIKDLRP